MIQIKAESLPIRCEICHQTDCFDPASNTCSRCNDVTALVQQATRQAGATVSAPRFAALAEPVSPFAALDEFRTLFTRLERVHPTLPLLVGLGLLNVVLVPFAMLMTFPHFQWAFVFWAGTMALVVWRLNQASPQTGERTLHGLSSIATVLFTLLVSLGCGILLYGITLLPSLVQTIDNPDCVRMALRLGTSPNQPAAILAAAERGRAQSLQALLEAGASLEVKNKDGRTPLLIAADLNHLHTAEMLVRAKANVNAQDDFKFTPLVLAARSKGGNEPHKTIELCRLLLQQGANPNTADWLGRTALMYAAENGDFELVNLLCEQGANVNLTDREFQTALLLAEQSRATDAGSIVNLLLERGANPNAVNQKGKSPLYYAVSQDGESSLLLLRQLIAKGADVRLCGYETLLRAVDQENLPVVQFLLEMQVSPNPEVESADTTPLGLAIAHKNVDMVRLLLAHWAQVNEPVKAGYTLLIRAVVKGSPEIVKMLVEKGEQVNTANEAGETSLMYAARNGEKEIAAYLLAHGARVQATDSAGETALDYANRSLEPEAMTAILHKR
ncbi:MAG: ankyrin repeat domain-containing protein [Blastocatellia bacterium]|nr:ankyrin repeat domain-containing protein [Blastocatellia bacterium]